MPSCCQVAIVCDIQYCHKSTLDRLTLNNLKQYNLYYLTIIDDVHWYKMASKILKKNVWKHKNQIKSNNGFYNVHVFSLRRK